MSQILNLSKGPNEIKFFDQQRKLIFHHVMTN